MYEVEPRGDKIKASFFFDVIILFFPSFSKLFNPHVLRQTIGQPQTERGGEDDN